MWNPRPNEILHRLVRSQADSHTYSDFHDDFVGHEAIRRWFHYIKSSYIWCFRHQLLLPRHYLVLTKPLRLDIQCQRAASVKISWKYLDD